MSPNVTTRDRLVKRAQAAVLLAEDDLTDEQIAETVGVTRRSLARWKADSTFAAEVGGHVGAIQAGMLRLAIAKKHKRLAVLDALHTKSLQVIEERARRYQAKAGDDPETVAAMAARSVFGREVPYEATLGLLAEKESVNVAGHRTTEWSVDTGLMREIRALHEQAAKELGQWVDRSETDITTRTVQIVGIDAETL